MPTSRATENGARLPSAANADPKPAMIGGADRDAATCPMNRSFSSGPPRIRHADQSAPPTRIRYDGIEIELRAAGARRVPAPNTSLARRQLLRERLRVDRRPPRRHRDRVRGQEHEDHVERHARPSGSGSSSCELARRQERHVQHRAEHPVDLEREPAPAARARRSRRRATPRRTSAARWPRAAGTAGAAGVLLRAERREDAGDHRRHEREDPHGEEDIGLLLAPHSTRPYDAGMPSPRILLLVCGLLRPAAGSDRSVCWPRPGTTAPRSWSRRTPPVRTRPGCARWPSGHGLTIGAIHAPASCLTRRVWGTDPIGKVERAIEVASDAEVPLVVVHPPYRWQRSFRRWLEERLPSSDASDRRDRRGREHVPGAGRAREMTFHADQDLEELEGLPDLVLDTSHAAVAEHDLVEVRRRFDGRIRHVHLSDNAGKGWDSHLPPGEGVLPLGAFLDDLSSE